MSGIFYACAVLYFYLVYLSTRYCQREYFVLFLYARATIHNVYFVRDTGVFITTTTSLLLCVVSQPI
jgi:hypothetical protein